MLAAFSEQKCDLLLLENIHKNHYKKGVDGLGKSSGALLNNLGEIASSLTPYKNIYTSNKSSEGLPAIIYEPICQYPCVTVDSDCLEQQPLF